MASGDFYKGKLSKGVYIFGNGDKYYGEFSQGVMYGSGKYTSGNWVQDNMSNVGV